jgi:hypothetical protein
MTSMFVPDPVVSLALLPKEKNDKNFGKALGRFTKEDPTFRVHTDNECVPAARSCARGGARGGAARARTPLCRARVRRT